MRLSRRRALSRRTPPQGKTTAKAVAEEATARGATPLLGSSTGLRAAARSRGRSHTNQDVSAEHDAETPAR